MLSYDFCVVNFPLVVASGDVIRLSLGDSRQRPDNEALDAAMSLMSSRLRCCCSKTDLDGQNGLCFENRWHTPSGLTVVHWTCMLCHGIASDRQMFNKLKRWVNWIKPIKTIGMILSYPSHSVLIKYYHDNIWLNWRRLHDSTWINCNHNRLKMYKWNLLNNNEHPEEPSVT